MDSWLRKEYMLKGVFLGLWVYVALQAVGLNAPTPAGAAGPAAAKVHLPWVLGWLAAGLAGGLLAGAAVQLRRGVRPWHNWLAFPLLVVLDSSRLVTSGMVVGLAAGVLSGRAASEVWAGPVAGWFGLGFEQVRHAPGVENWLWYCAVGGAVLGFGFYQLTQVKDPLTRLGMGFGVAVLLVYLSIVYADRIPGMTDPDTRYALGVYILAGLPFFYLLSFCSEADESEAEIMALCAALGVAFHLMGIAQAAANLGAVGFLLPAALYFVYATKVLPGLRVFKHTLRGFSHLNLGRLRDALFHLGNAQRIDPNNALARQGMQALHRGLTLARLDAEPELIELLDFTICLDRAAVLLMNPPTPAQKEEAERFLTLVEQRRPRLQPRVDYLRAVAHLHVKDLDAAAGTLSRLLDPETPYPGAAACRRQVLFPAWQLALGGPDSLVQRLGRTELEKPGRRIEALAAVERHLAARPQDGGAVAYRDVLYRDLTEAEFVAAAAVAPPADFNYERVEQLGLALVDDAEPSRRDRGAEYLRMAGRGLPDRAPGIFSKLADAATRAGDRDLARGYLEQVKRAGLSGRVKQLPTDQREVYFAALRKLADEAEAAGDHEAAVTDLRQFLADGGGGELDTYRRLADLYGNKLKDPLNGVAMVETGLIYSGKDAKLLEMKASFYRSVEPDKLAEKKDKVAGFFDVAYCVKSATAGLGRAEADPDWLEYAGDLAKLALVMQPASASVRLLNARVLLRRGDRDQGVSILEDIREAKKGSGEDEEAWYTATRILGDMYLSDLNRPDLAVKCFQDYREHGRSGADTLFKLAQAYEAGGDKANACKFYNAVTAYEQHPRYWEAKDAMSRLECKT